MLARFQHQLRRTQNRLRGNLLGLRALKPFGHAGVGQGLDEHMHIGRETAADGAGRIKLRFLQLNRATEAGQQAFHRGNIFGRGVTIVAMGRNAGKHMGRSVRRSAHNAHGLGELLLQPGNSLARRNGYDGLPRAHRIANLGDNHFVLVGLHGKEQNVGTLSRLKTEHTLPHTAAFLIAVPHLNAQETAWNYQVTSLPKIEQLPADAEDPNKPSAEDGQRGEDISSLLKTGDAAPLAIALLLLAAAGVAAFAYYQRK